MRQRDEWLNKSVLKKVYNSGGRNDGIAIVRARQLKTVGKVRGYEYDRLSLIPFFDAVRTKDGKEYIAWQHRKMTVYGKKAQFHPIVGIDYIKAKDLAYAILDAIDEPRPDEEEWDDHKDKKKQDELRKKIKKIGL